jgi:hypothetical protein
MGFAGIYNFDAIGSWRVIGPVVDSLIRQIKTQF